jgi:hypothetical protein
VGGMSGSPMERLGSSGAKARRQGRQAVLLARRSMLAQTLRPRRMQHWSCLTRTLHDDSDPELSALSANEQENRTPPNDICRPLCGSMGAV